jgi:hypothetical protein
LIEAQYVGRVLGLNGISLELIRWISQAYVHLQRMDEQVLVAVVSGMMTPYVLITVQQQQQQQLYGYHGVEVRNPHRAIFVARILTITGTNESVQIACNLIWALLIGGLVL